MTTSDVDMKSEEEDRKERKRTKEDERSRSRSKEKRPKKHKKEKKRKRKHSSDEDTGGEGGDTPERESRKEERAIPGLAKYESEGEEGEIERKRGRSRSREKRDRSRSREKRDRSKERRDRSRSRDRKDRSRSRERRRDEKSRKRSRSRERGGGKEEKGKEQEPGEIGGEGSQQVLSLSIDETNKLRAKLGLKPLNVNKAEAEETAEEKKQPGVLIPGDRDRTRHLAPEHWGEKARTKKLAERIAEKRDQRKVRGKLDRIKGLGEESSDEDDAGKWIEKQRRKVAAKEAAEKRAKELEELDNEFGVEALVSNSLKEDRQTEYDRKNLKGLKVGHSAEVFGEKSTILTLADGDILDDKYVDTLTNVNIEDDERTKKSHQNVKDFKEGYKAYDSEVIDEMTGEVQKKELLYQYKESLEGEKKESFTLEAEGEFSEEVKRERELAKIRYKLKLQNTTSLDMPAPQLARDFFTTEEMKEKASFKKVKKKKNKEGVRKSKMLKADDLLAMTSEAGAQQPVKKRRERPAEDQSLPDGRLPQPMDVDDGDDLAGDIPNAAPLDLDPEPVIPRALLIARKLKAKQGKVEESSVDKVAERVLARKDDDAAANGYEGGVELVLDQTAEFCRGLGEVGHWQDMQSGLSGGTVDKELLDFEAGLEQEAGARMRSAVEWSKQMDLDEEEKAGVGREERQRGTWEEVEETEVEEGKWKEGARGAPRRRGEKSGREDGQAGGGKQKLRPAILEDEDLAKTGMGAVLNMARRKGFLDQEEEGRKDMGLKDLICKDYKIDDKSRKDQEEDDRKRGRGRDRGSYGPTSSFSEKKGYKPTVNLEYIDDNGRAMSSKEAFRFLSHKFHGKGSGKLKTEKRFRKVEEDKMMEKMSSVDTPLGTLNKLQRKTKDLATPYVVLSGNKGAMGGGPNSLKK